MPLRPRSLRYEYELYVEREIEDYKNSVSRSALLSLADEAMRRLGTDRQMGMMELLLTAEVDKLIFGRLRLPSYDTWRKRRQRNATELQRPEHWGLRGDTPLKEAIPSLAGTGSVLVTGARVEGSALYLAANGCAVTAVEPERDVVERMLENARAAGLDERVHGTVSELHTYLHAWTPTDPLTAVVCTPAAFAGLSGEERARVIDVLKSVTRDGGVHLVETIVAGSSMIDEDELRQQYDGWQISIVPDKGASKTFMARKAVA
ncbi:MAG: hypothetical protein FJ363_09345 [Gemmatimonadetes bacterium]|nr:hypothetical protein [Gemmatimonadota bacterium]